jgi:drug/metabolite transporter (DMT)-like permease
MEHAVLKERAGKKMLAGLIISLSGIILIVGAPIFTQGISGQLMGNLFFLISTIAHVAYTIASKKILYRYHTFFVTYWTFLIGALSFLPFFMIESTKYNPLFSLDFRGILGITFGIFLSSALAYFLYDWGLKRISSQEVGIFSYLDPLAATIIAIPLLHESIGSVFILGSVLIFAGIAIAEGRFHYHPFHKI